MTSVVGMDVRVDPGGETAELVADLIRRGGETGLQVCVVRGGEVVLDVSGGTGSGGHRPVDGDTLVPVFSVSKSVLSIVVLTLLADGTLALDDPIAAHWPDFAAAGKAGITVRHVLTHTSGLPQVPDGTTVADMCDWELMTTRIAAMSPLWPEGTGTGYHILSWGWIVGETVRRALGSTESVGAITRRVFGGRPGCEEFWFGLPEDRHHRVAPVHRAPTTGPDPQTMAGRALPRHLAVGQQVWGLPEVRRATIPGAGGITTAHALASIHAALVDPADALVPSAWVERATTVQSRGHDVVVGERLGRGFGHYASPADDAGSAPFAAGTRRIGHPGSGGSIAWADPGTGAGVAITRTRLTPAGWRDAAVQRLVAAAESACR